MFLLHPIRSLKAILKSFEDRLRSIEGRQRLLQVHIEYVQEALGRVESRQLTDKTRADPSDNEFRVYSQWGEDGIIQFLLRHIRIENKIFVEFGVEDYTEANTRFLLVNDNWTGLVLDSDSENIAKLKNSRIYWLYNLKAVQAFVTKDNINDILTANGVVGEIGLLSIDIDGNDYWVWRAIEVINPIIVIIEYNHRFGKDIAVTVPYEESFDRRKSPQPWIYFGASLRALCLLAERKGYAFVGCNSHGVNAFFVRKDKKPHEIREVSPEKGFREGKFSESRDDNGLIMKTQPEEEKRLIMKLPLTNVKDPDFDSKG